MLQKVVFILLIACSALANVQITKERAQELARDYYKSQLTKKFSLADDCPVRDRSSCIRVICDNTSTCNFDSEIKKVAEACRGVSGDCLSVICESTSSCNFESSAFDLAQSCKSSNGLCTKVGCEKTNACQFSSDAKQVAQACSGVVDGECVSAACERSSGCQFLSNFVEIARACSGN